MKVDDLFILDVALFVCQSVFYFFSLCLPFLLFYVYFFFFMSLFTYLLTYLLTYLPQW